MTTIAVTAAASPLGKALIARLDADERIERILAVDVEAPPMPVAKLELRQADIRDPDLAVAFAGADVVVHLGPSDEPSHNVDEAFSLAVSGTRKVLAAAAAARVSAVVHRSSALAYGAHPDTPVPLSEAAPLRGNPDFTPAHHHVLAEQLIADFRTAHPDVRTAVLRSAPTYSAELDGWRVRWLQSPRLPIVATHSPPHQLLHLDDLAAALHVAAVGQLDGDFNVAPDGWLAHDELCQLVGRRSVEVPEAVAFSGTRQAWEHGVATLPPGALHLLMHPLVLRADALHAAGWHATRSNREVLKEVIAAHGSKVAVGPVRVELRHLVLAGCAALGALVGLILARRRDR